MEYILLNKLPRYFRENIRFDQQQEYCIDITSAMNYYSSTYLNSKEDFYYGTSLLHEMPCQERDEGSKVHHHEEWQASDPGDVPYMRDQDVPDWEELTISTRGERSARTFQFPVLQDAASACI